MVGLIKNYFKCLFGLYADLDTARRIHTVKNNDDHEPVNSLHRREDGFRW